jgi:hypothetical protein
MALALAAGALGYMRLARRRPNSIPRSPQTPLPWPSSSALSPQQEVHFKGWPPELGGQGRPPLPGGETDPR